MIEYTNSIHRDYKSKCSYVGRHPKSTARETNNSKVTKHLDVIQQKYKAVMHSKLLQHQHYLQPLVYTAAKHQSVGHSCALGHPKVVLASSVIEVELVDIC